MTHVCENMVLHETRANLSSMAQVSVEIKSI